MANHEHETIQEVIRMMLQPIASLVLKCGLTWREFSELSKAAFVERATAEFGIRGRPTNVSRVSILTGISRKEVKRQREIQTEEQRVPSGKTTDATRVLSGWHQNPGFVAEDGEPLELAEKGASPSFETLCKSYSGDIPATAMLKELLKTKAVERTRSGKLRVLMRHYQPAVHDEEILRNAVSRIYDLTQTVNNNVFPSKDSVPRFGGAADNDRMPRSALPEFKAFLDSRGQSFLEEVDDWLAAHAVKNESSNTDCVRVGVGLFAIED